MALKDTFTIQKINLNEKDISYNTKLKELETYVDKTKSVKDFPYPQISRTFKRLSHGKPIVPISEDKSLPDGDKNLTITRTDVSNVKQRMYLPDYYRKDRFFDRY